MKCFPGVLALEGGYTGIALKQGSHMQDATLLHGGHLLAQRSDLPPKLFQNARLALGKTSSQNGYCHGI